MTYDPFIWGKTEPRCSLAQHMIAVGTCCTEYLSSPSSSGTLDFICACLGVDKAEAVSDMAYLCAMHDIGKAHPDFQFRDPYARDLAQKEGLTGISSGDLHFRHELYTAQTLEALWEDRPDDFPGEDSDLFLAVVRLHHQGKVQSSPREPRSSIWNEIHMDLDERMRTIFQPGKAIRRIQDQDALGILMTAILILCDWVASSAAIDIDPGTPDKQLYDILSRLARRSLKDYGLISECECSFPTDIDFTCFWPNIPRNGMRPLQKSCEELSAGDSLLTIVEAPPGEGKTEAALYLAGRACAAFRKRGIYMALPTTATSNQMSSRINSLLGKRHITKARLMHSSAWMLDEVSPSNTSVDTEDPTDQVHAAEWLRPMRRAMLSENAVGTVDQAMAAVLWLKYGMLRLSGLESKVLIIDEIHAYDVYMSTIISRLLEWCRALNVPVILLSATLQEKQKLRYLSIYTDRCTAQDKAYPLITCVNKSGDIRYVHPDGTYMHGCFNIIPCKVSGADETGGIVDLVLRTFSGKGCVCVMLNTVARAQEVYRALKNSGIENTMLFHARFRMERRQTIEQKCLELFNGTGTRPDGFILVCTQVVEQSLDLDFDCMITQLAPIDLLIQRMGRVHRHSDVVRPSCFTSSDILVCIPDAVTEDIEHKYGVNGYIYAPHVLHSTEKWIGCGRELRMPQDIRPAVDEVYTGFDDAEIASYIRQQVKDDADKVSAEGNIYPSPRANRFFGSVRSMASQFSLQDVGNVDVLTASFTKPGASTRSGDDSVRISFMENNEMLSGTEKEQALKIFARSCSIPLTKPIWDAIISSKEQECKLYNDGNTKYLNDCLVLYPQHDGTYRLGDLIFHDDDELGIYWEVNEH